MFGSIDRRGSFDDDSTRPASTDVPAATATSLTRPAFGERSSFSIFIASTTTTGWRALDLVAGGDEHADDAAGHGRERPSARRAPRRRCRRRPVRCGGR